MDNPRTFPMSSVFKDIGHRSVTNSTARKATIQRLSAPKPKDKRWIPDRPSVYWLDYIIDPTPQKLKDPEELASYYDNFEPRFPRTKLLSAPRPYYGTMCDDNDSLSRPTSVHTGIPISALTYKASDRIKELARPKTTVSENNNFTETSSTLLRPTTSRQALSTARSHSPKEKLRYFDPIVDLARGDFPSRSKHGIHTSASKERIMSTTSPLNSKLRLRSRSNNNNSYHKTGGTITRDILRNDKSRPMSRTLYSGRH